MIHLGYETGTGRPVSIPLAHMAVTGQTQQSGKTTTMEALVDRGELRAVVFITKPGEKSFSEGRRILPFFKEHADWEYVKELLEVRRSESLSKWDGYLMRVCHGARTLQHVRDNVEKELPKKRSARPSHYEVLAGYLDLIIPELERVPYTDKLELQRGVNIMDLSAKNMSDDMQSMVIRSTIEQIHKREKNTVLVLPEAWKFIPEGGRSSVFQALQSLIREGATNGNYVWIDAQDLAVVSKRILKSVSVWILGKQQEANEVARTINHLIEPLQIRPDMIKSLGIGQFLICADNHPARRVYVQPKWLGELDALAIARGEESVETAQAIFRQKKKEVSLRVATEKHNLIRPEELAAVTQPLADNVMQAIYGGTDEKKKSASDRRRQNLGSAGGDPRGSENGNDARSGSAGAVPGEDETVWKERAEKAEAEIVNLRKLLNDYRDGVPPLKNADPPITAPIDWIYAQIIQRAQDDPKILQLLATRPELCVTVTPRTIEIREDSCRGWLAMLISKGFFSEPRNGNVAFNELQRLGKKIAKPNVYRELATLAEWGFLTAEESGYQATGLKVTVEK